MKCTACQKTYNECKCTTSKLHPFVTGFLESLGAKTFDPQINEPPAPFSGHKCKICEGPLFCINKCEEVFKQGPGGGRHGKDL